MSHLKKVLLGFAISIVLISVFWFPLALGLMAGFPFALWDDPGDPVAPVTRATFEESAVGSTLVDLWTLRKPLLPTSRSTAMSTR